MNKQQFTVQVRNYLDCFEHATAAPAALVNERFNDELREHDPELASMFDSLHNVHVAIRDHIRTKLEIKQC
jgi:hypothetical protein